MSSCWKLNGGEFTDGILDVGISGENIGSSQDVFLSFDGFNVGRDVEIKHYSDLL